MHFFRSFPVHIGTSWCDNLPKIWSVLTASRKFVTRYAKMFRILGVSSCTESKMCSPIGFLLRPLTVASSFCYYFNGLTWPRKTPSYKVIISPLRRRYYLLSDFSLIKFVSWRNLHLKTKLFLIFLRNSLEITLGSRHDSFTE